MRSMRPSRTAVALGLAMCVVACSSKRRPPPRHQPPPAGYGPPPPYGAPGQYPQGQAPPPGMPVAPPPRQPVPGPFSSERIQQIVRANFNKIAACYERGLARDPNMAGQIRVSIAIDGDGSVISAKAPRQPQAGMITDEEVVSCVEREFKMMRFPETKKGMQHIVYPVNLNTE